METSAKTGMNAQELFTEAAKLLFKDYNLYIVKKKKVEMFFKKIIILYAKDFFPHLISFLK